MSGLRRTGHLYYDDNKDMEVPVNFLKILLPALGLIVWVVDVSADEFSCTDQPVIVVNADDAKAVQDICESAGKALQFLSLYELRPQRTIRINIVDRQIMSEGYDAFGSYDIRSEVITLMSYRSILNQVAVPEMYGEPFDEVHYTGATAHEVAHAVMLHNLLTKHISQAPQEYLAHATQMAVMPEERRNKIIDAMDVGPWEPGDAISDIYMAIEPGKFAVKSYLHLTALEDPEEFVQILLKANWFYVYVP